MPRRVKNPAPENSATQKAQIAVQFWTQSASDKWKSARMRVPWLTSNSPPKPAGNFLSGKADSTIRIWKFTENNTFSDFPRR